MMEVPFQPRLLRLRDVPRYLGMDRNRFNKEVRPYVTEIPIGRQGIAFDRYELDSWIDEYKARKARPPRRIRSRSCPDSYKESRKVHRKEAELNKNRASSSFDEAVEELRKSR